MFFIFFSGQPSCLLELSWMLFRRWQTWRLEPEVRTHTHTHTHTHSCSRCGPDTCSYNSRIGIFFLFSCGNTSALFSQCEGGMSSSMNEPLAHPWCCSCGLLPRRRLCTVGERKMRHPIASNFVSERSFHIETLHKASLVVGGFSQKTWQETEDAKCLLDRAAAVIGCEPDALRWKSLITIINRHLASHTVKQGKCFPS